VTPITVTTWPDEATPQIKLGLHLDRRATVDVGIAVGALCAAREIERAGDQEVVAIARLNGRLSNCYAAGLDVPLNALSSATFTRNSTSGRILLVFRAHRVMAGFRQFCRCFGGYVTILRSNLLAYFLVKTFLRNFFGDRLSKPAKPLLFKSR
jgi:hypothetical protein